MTRDINPYSDSVTEAAVVAAVAERLAVAESGWEAIEIGDRELIRLLRRDGDTVVETLLDPDDYRDAPRAKTGLVTLLTVPSLIEYVRRHQQDGTTVYAVPKSGRFEVVLDDHVAGTAPAGWGNYRAVCNLEAHPDFLHWTSKDGRLMHQVDFAEHIEAGVHTVVQPPAADLLEVAQTLTGSRNVTWRSGQRLSDGQVQFRYEEEVQGRAGAGGNIEIPQTFTLRFPPFEGSPTVDVTAAFRWRLNDGHVQLGYRLQQLDAAVREVTDSLIDDIERELDVRVLLGRPRSNGDTAGLNIGASRR